MCIESSSYGRKAASPNVAHRHLNDVPFAFLYDVQPFDLKFFHPRRKPKERENGVEHCHRRVRNGVEHCGRQRIRSEKPSRCKSGPAQSISTASPRNTRHGLNTDEIMCSRAASSADDGSSSRLDLLGISGAATRSRSASRDTSLIESAPDHDTPSHQTASFTEAIHTHL